MGYVSTGMGDRLSSKPYGMCLSWNVLCRQTFINSSALLVSLMAVQLAHVDQKTFRPRYVVGPGQGKKWLQFSKRSSHLLETKKSLPGGGLHSTCGYDTINILLHFILLTKVFQLDL